MVLNDALLLTGKKTAAEEEEEKRMGSRREISIITARQLAGQLPG